MIPGAGRITAYGYVTASSLLGRFSSTVSDSEFDLGTYHLEGWRLKADERR
jgi:hypothetical protein